jgi:predicted lactoylglutathione lyase
MIVWAIFEPNISVMKSKKIWANFSVQDLKRTTIFYKQLGFKHNGASDQLTSFFFGEENFIIHFFLKDVLEPAMKGQIIDSKAGNEIIFTLSADSKEEVNSWEKEIREAGGTIVSKPEEFGEGYYGFVFADPDGHKFNVFHM